MRVVISGGGTGGHIFPAIAIADKIKEKNANTEILFVGASGRMEMEKVPKAGYLIEGLWISGLQRKLTTRNLLFPFKLMSSLFKAYRILKRFKPDIAIGVGGYASGPTLAVASRMGIPTLIQEQNSYPGITNKLLSKKADRICVAYMGMDNFFPKEKMMLTGNPMRSSFYNPTLSKEESLEHFGLDKNKKTLLLFGGSLGARSLNEAVGSNIELLKARTDLQMIWQVGKGYFEEYNEKYGSIPQIKLLPFIDRMDMAYKVADLAITRAGALNISELALMGQATILVPSPNVAEDHQTKNARALESRDAAIMLADNRAKDELIPMGLSLIEEEDRLEALRINIKMMAQPNAAELVVNEVMKLCSNGNQ